MDLYDLICEECNDRNEIKKLWEECHESIRRRREDKRKFLNYKNFKKNNWFVRRIPTIC